MKKLIYLFAITFIICGCTVHRFTTLESFDKPEYEVRDFDSTVTGIYDGTYNNVYDAYNDFSMVADSLIAMQLKTKNTFTVEAPFTVKVRARMHPASLALYCPLWIMPVEDAGGRIVSEFDIVESFGDLSKVVLSGHIGKNGYGNHKMYQKFILTRWNGTHTKCELKKTVSNGLLIMNLCLISKHGLAKKNIIYGYQLL